MKDFDEWLDENYEDLLAECAECAESGADYELDFDFERFCEDRYYELLAKESMDSNSPSDRYGLDQFNKLLGRKNRSFLR